MRPFLKITLAAFLLFQSLWAQQVEESQLLFELKQPLIDLESDHLEQHYLLYADKLVKVDEDGEEIAQFSRPDLGTPDHIQVYDPLRILLHYSAFNQIILLDNRLNPLTEGTSLFELGLVDVPCSAMADENFIWVFDQVSDRLMKVDIRVPEISFRTPPLTQLIKQESSFILMRSNVRGVVVLVDKGVIEFDAMGNFSRFTPYEEADDLHLLDQGWIVSKDGELWKSGKKKISTMPTGSHWSVSAQSVIFGKDKQVFSLPILH